METETLPITAKEIAESIVGADGDLQPAIERVRHWTREGLLVPVGDRNPGTGRKRFYEDDALVSARVLNVLADFGIGVGVMRTALVLGHHAATEIADKRSQGIVCFLIIDKGGAVGPNPLARLHEQPDVRLDRPGLDPLPLGPVLIGEAALVINLTALLS